jgi:hypothetical protein
MTSGSILLNPTSFAFLSAYSPVHQSNSKCTHNDVRVNNIEPYVIHLSERLFGSLIRNNPIVDSQYFSHPAGTSLFPLSYSSLSSSHRQHRHPSPENQTRSDHWVHFSLQGFSRCGGHTRPQRPDRRGHRELAPQYRRHRISPVRRVRDVAEGSRR